MKPEITFGTFHHATNQHGDTELYPDEYFTLTEVMRECECEKEDVETLTGYYARLSMPGYLDCTEWAGPFDTVEEAEEYLTDTYGDE